MALRRAMESKCLSAETINDELTVLGKQLWLTVPGSDVSAMREEMKHLEECSQDPTVHI